MVASDVEDLLAQALAAHDAGPDALAEFLATHADHRATLERGLERCRQMGLLAGHRDAVDFPPRLGAFRLVRRLGGGGMGTVYEAVQDDLNRKVALKVIRPELLYVAGARERFRREIDAISHLDHPAIVTIVAAGEHEGVPFFAMQLLAGADIAEATAPLRGRSLSSLRGADLHAAIVSHALENNGAASAADLPDAFAGAYWEAAVRALVQVGDGLSHAHAHGIVHRDLKPSNVMLMPDGRAIVLDFGVARMRGARDLTRSGEPGSPAFMSPEQLRGEPTDERTDVYSLGLTFWQFLARQAPFAANQSETEIMRGDLPRLSHHQGLPRDLAVVLHKATDRDRQRRYVTMADLVADLRAVLKGAAIRGRRLPLALRLGRCAQRHRVTTAVAATVAIASIVVPIVVGAEKRAAQVAVADAAQRAEQSLLATLDTLATTEDKMGGSSLPDIAEVDPLARTVLEDSLRHYRELLTTHRDHGRLRRQAAAAMLRSGQFRERTGNASTGVELFREALTTIGDLNHTAPTDLFEQRGYVHIALAATATRQQDLKQAREHSAAATRDFDVVEQREPGSIAALRARSELAVTTAKLYGDRNEVDTHERHLRDALTLALAWFAKQPDNIDARIVRVRRHSSLGVHLRRVGKLDEAQVHLRAAVAAARELPDNNRLWPPPRALQSMAMESYANVLIDRKDPAAKTLLEECVTLREALLERLPDQVVFRVHLANTYQNLGRAHLMLDESTHAEEWLRRACDVQLGILASHPDHGEARTRLENHRYVLATALSNQGKIDALLANAEDLARAKSNAVAQHTAAWSFLRAMELSRETAPERYDALWQAYGKRAMDLLLATEAAGWDPVWRLERKVYDPLRALGEFKVLEARVQAKSR